jgi:hypothetical protein
MRLRGEQVALPIRNISNKYYAASLIVRRHSKVQLSKDESEWW